MSLPRLRLERSTYSEGIWHIPPDEVHHLIRVRRCYNGSLVEGLIDGEKISLRLECRGEEVYAREISRTKEEICPPRVELLLGLLKNDQLDEALRFCAETGIARVTLLFCERSVPRFDEAQLLQKRKRWQKILDEATKQSGAARAPELFGPISFEELDFNALPKQRLAAMLAEGTKPLRDIEIADDTVTAIGPEGDWSPKESARLLSEGFIPVTLGRRIMRASTAVAAAGSGIAMLYKQREP